MFSLKHPVSTHCSIQTPLRDKAAYRNWPDRIKLWAREAMYTKKGKRISEGWPSEEMEVYLGGSQLLGELLDFLLLLHQQFLDGG